MRTRIVVATLVIAGLAGLAVPATAAAAAKKTNPHATYALKAGQKKCKVHFVKRTLKHKVRGKEVRYVGCVYVAPKSAPVVIPPAPVTPTPAAPASNPPAPSYSYAAHLDPSFTQGALPLNVTYTFTADATETLNGATTDLAQAQQLPGGILDLYSNGSLKCSLNVGGGVTQGTCGVTYNSYGHETVVTEYIPSSVAPVTETDTEDIEPFSPTVTAGTATIGSETVDGSSNYAVRVTIPVTVSGQGTTPTGTLTSTGWTCSTLTNGSGSCSETVENEQTQTVLSPSIAYSGDSNYSSGGVTGAATVPAAPAPTNNNIATTTVCDAPGSPQPVCLDVSGATVTTDAQVFDPNSHLVQTGTITFTDNNGVQLCVATLQSGVAKASCTGNVPGGSGTPIATPVTATYSGASVNQGDAYVDVYQVSSGQGHAD